MSILLWLFTMVNLYNSTAVWFKYLLCISPNLALSFCMETVLQYERSCKQHLLSLVIKKHFNDLDDFQVKRLNVSNVFTSFYEDEVSLGALILIMNLWSVFYLLLSWYLERVKPGEYGVKLPFYFPFMVKIF
jgi:hypothetical protein